MNCKQLFQRCAKIFEIEGVGTVGFGACGSFMHFDEETVDGGCNRGTRERFDEFRLASGSGTGGAGELNAVGSVEDDGISGIAHGFETAHIDYEVVVAEGRSAFGKDDFVSLAS